VSAPAESQDEYATRLLKCSRFTAPAVRQAIGALVPPASIGLDVGCGIGRDTLWLGQAVGPGGKVTGVDLSADFLKTAREAASLTEYPERFCFQQGDLRSLPFHADTFDWVWCKDAFWPGPTERGGVVPDPVMGVREFARVVRPGGVVALVYWTGQKLLPGYPALEARLEVALSQWIPYLRDIPPERHYLRALAWMRAAGLEDTQAQCFAASLYGPLGEALQDSVACVLDMLYGGLESLLSSEDWQLVQRLCRLESDEYLPRHPFYYCSVDYTLFRGRRPAADAAGA
jgi:SAM-dependent methyltransferase